MRLLALAVGVLYLVWRAVFTWQGSHLALFGALLVAETYGIARSHIELSMIRRPPWPWSKKRGTAEIDADVIVLALDEPASEIRAALLSARAIRGGGDVILVDRDDRPELGELTQRLEVARITGSSPADVGALVTQAVSRGNRDRIVLIPGDVVVMPDIASVSEPCFEDPEVAVVVGQIEAANATRAVDYDGYGQSRERDLLFAPCLDADHALPWWAGVSVIRREAIGEAGGFAPHRRSVTLATGVRLQVGGWRIADSGVVIARRLASWTEERHLHRWARDLHDRLELLCRKDLSFSSARITPRMRLAYYSALVDGTRPFQRLLLVGVLFATLMGVGLPLAGPAPLLVGAWAAQMGTRLLARTVATRPVGFRPWILADIRLLTTELVIATRVLRGRRFDEELHDPPPGYRMRALMFWALPGLLIAGTVAFVFGDREYGDVATISLLVLSAWLFAVLIRAKTSLIRRQVRQGYRAIEDPDVPNTGSGLAVAGVSPFGVDIVSNDRLEVGERLRLAFDLPAADGSTTRLENATVVRRCTKDGRHFVGYLRFTLITDEEMDRLIEYCAVVAGHRDIRKSGEHIEARLVRPGEVTEERSDGEELEAGVGAKDEEAADPEETESVRTIGG